MKFLFLLIAPIFSFKLCSNCKHFITDNKENIFGKCKMFPQIENKINYLINGIKKRWIFLLFNRKRPPKHVWRRWENVQKDSYFKTEKCYIDK